MPIKPESGFYSTYTAREQRIGPIEKRLYPFYRAQDLARCCLYWLPVASFPVPQDQVLWQMEFFDRLIKLLLAKQSLRLEVFLRFSAVTQPQMMDAVQQHALEFHPLLGLGRRPGAPLQLLSSTASIHQAPASTAADIHQIAESYCYWFVNKTERKQRESFLGHGGMTLLFLKPDPKAVVPPEIYFSPYVRRTNPAFRAMDVDALIAGAFAMTDGFLPKSKKLFGGGLENEVQFQGIPFVLPLLDSADFFQQTDGECGKWFQLFDVYVAESPSDMGVLLASQLDLDKDLIPLLQTMREQGLQYPDHPGMR